MLSQRAELTAKEPANLPGRKPSIARRGRLGCPAIMLAYLGWKRETEVSVTPIDLGCGAGEVPCFECSGDGDWTKFYPEPETLSEPMKCVECKGTGKVLVSI